MFNSTHTFVGLAIARIGAEKRVKYAALTAAIASNLPDIDSVAGLWGGAAYLDHHRGITHSLTGIPLLALLLAAVMYVFSGKFGKTYALALIVMATHPALDYLNAYGLRPFLPWSDKWFYGDVVFIIDLWIDLALAAGLVWGSIQPSWRRFAAILALSAMTAYIGVRSQLHSKLIASLRTNAVQNEILTEPAAMPNMSPRIWEAVLETDTGFIRFNVRPDGNIAGSRTSLPGFTTLTATLPSNVVAQASHSSSAAALLRFARFPMARVIRESTGYRVIFIDFRFYGAGGNDAWGSEVTLDESLSVTRDSLSLRQPVN